MRMNMLAGARLAQMHGFAVFEVNRPGWKYEIQVIDDPEEGTPATVAEGYEEDADAVMCCILLAADGDPYAQACLRKSRGDSLQRELAEDVGFDLKTFRPKKGT